MPERKTKLVTTQQRSRSEATAHIREVLGQIGNLWHRVFKRRGAGLVAILLVALLPSLYFYNQSREFQNTSGQATNGKLQTTSEVVARVSRHILLPSGEQPTVATVTDAGKVRNQAFFASAASGDKVLIYAQAKKAYLYRPGIDRVIEVAPLAPNSAAGAAAPPVEPPAGQ